MVSIHHHGAVDGVTGSCHELIIDKKISILIDCGLFQGAETADKASQDQPTIDFNIESVQALLVTHCHIDHVGRIPYLLAAGFRGKIYCSEPTAILLPLVLEDAVKIGFTRNQRLVNQFIKQFKTMIQPVAYNQRLNIPLPEHQLNVKFKRAGHILGSAYIECHVVKDQSIKNKLVTRKQYTKVIFSGDLGAPHSPLLYAPRSPYSADILVLESTYGNRIHENRRTRKQKLKSWIVKCFKNRGVILIPAFSIGRTQELLYELEHIIHLSRHEKVADNLIWDDLEIIVDSPLASRFTSTYNQLKPYWDKEARKRLQQGRNPLAFEQITTIDDHNSHLQTIRYLKKNARPTIVIAASGMCNGGRIMNYLKQLINDDRTDILFVGYQARGTLGYKIQQHQNNQGTITIDGQQLDVKAGIHQLSSYSAHADQNNLLHFIKRMRIQPKQIRLIHGDQNAKITLQKKILTTFKNIEVIIP